MGLIYHSSPRLLRRLSAFFVSFPLSVAVFASLATLGAFGQEKYLVATQDGVMSLYDLATNSLVESFKGTPDTFRLTAGPNSRIAFAVGGSGYATAMDTTIGKAVTQLSPVRGPDAALTRDGKLFLVDDYTYQLRIVDTATLSLVRSVSFKSVIGQFLPGSIVAAQNKAFIFPRNHAPYKVAVIDLMTYALSTISLPPGIVCRRCAALTADGSVIVVAVRENSDGKTHIVLISAITNSIVADIVQTTDPGGVSFLVVSPSMDPNKMFGYAIAGGRLKLLDLRPQSQTFGQILPSTAVDLNGSAEELVINADGSRLVLGEFPFTLFTPNVEIFDAEKMLADPGHALLARVTVNGGAPVYSVCTRIFAVTPPNTAPVVSTVSGNFYNDHPFQLQITGANFKSGALVRIGGMERLSSIYNGPTALTVPVPVNAPAGKGLDVIVTNPQSQDPPEQQNQSGALTGSLNILLNPSVQPATQFAIASEDNSTQLYDSDQRILDTVPPALVLDGPISIAFNADGKQVYVAGYAINSMGVLPVDVKTRTAGPPINLPLDATFIPYRYGLASSFDPQTGKPLVYVAWQDFSTFDLHVSAIDSDSASPTFNTITKTFSAGVNDSSVFQDGIWVTPDGTYAYVPYSGSNPELGIFDLRSGAFSSISYSSLGIRYNQTPLAISPDGKSLLLIAQWSNANGIRVLDISDPSHPTYAADIPPIRIPGHGYLSPGFFQVIGNRLYVLDGTSSAAVLNFDRQASNFRMRGYSVNPLLTGETAAFSADGAYLYAVDSFSQSVAVFDTNRLESNAKDVLLTRFSSVYSPSLIAVSPVPPPPAPPIQKRKAGQDTPLGLNRDAPPGKAGPQRKLTY